MSKIIKLHNQYSFLAEEENGFQRPIARNDISSLLSTGKCRSIIIRNNETNEEVKVFTLEEFEKNDPENFLLYEDYVSPAAQRSLIDALRYLSELIVHRWNKGPAEYANYFIGNIDRYGLMNNRSIFWELKELKEKVDKELQARIDEYENVELLDKMVNMAHSFGLSGDMHYKYDGALVFRFNKEETDFLRSIKDLKMRLLDCFITLNEFEEMMTDEALCGRIEFDEVREKYLRDSTNVRSALGNLWSKMPEVEKSIPEKSVRTQMREDFNP